MTDFAMRRTMMVDTQVRPSDVTKFPIIDAMLNVAREEYVPDGTREAAYMGENISLDGGRVMLEPRSLAKMLDAVDIQSDDVVLDLGCGLGYSSAVISRIADFVVAVESDEQMAAEAQSILSQQGADNVAVIAGSLAEGNSKNGPYDVIMVQGAVETIPATICDQLKEGGRICCIFMDGALGTVKLGRKLDGKIVWRNSFNAGAPLIDGFQKTKEFIL
jgi:protein-L-isoaspartate(D-aspartate) O-methyltransferase